MNFKCIVPYFNMKVILEVAFFFFTLSALFKTICHWDFELC
jgi:hypothetical protein